MTWERFRKLFEEEYVAAARPGTRKVYANVLNLFERICAPQRDGAGKMVSCELSEVTTNLGLAPFSKCSALAITRRARDQLFLV